MCYNTTISDVTYRIIFVIGLDEIIDEISI